MTREEMLFKLVDETKDYWITWPIEDAEIFIRRAEVIVGYIHGTHELDFNVGANK